MDSAGLWLYKRRQHDSLPPDQTIISNVSVHLRLHLPQESSRVCLVERRCVDKIGSHVGPQANSKIRGQLQQTHLVPGLSMSYYNKLFCIYGPRQEDLVAV
jgi:hypothetical protein